ncbi:hypothetical protein GCM10011390_27140 [Aureimonas endophytica]|uniref:Uncharacterized protein n=1 Tax=Aureimonas endophytica TaxID=2027858 RepID=A0A916ZPG5_9HYPH|nr:hypothetical protein [Aureimonas endophytica]GGE06597.1 hypothetical protein GCM10011390_27140 [Aureimonas endophytica]
MDETAGSAFDRERILQAFDWLGREAIAAGQRLDIAVYGGSALMLASNFRYASEDVDVSLLGAAWPTWLRTAVDRIAEAFGLSQDWLNDAVEFHLSAFADRASDHQEFGTFPRDDEEVGLTVFVPAADYMLAMKLKAMRIADPAKGEQEAADILNLMRVVGITTPEEALAVLAKFYPKSAAQPEKQLFLLRHLLARPQGLVDAPRYPR